LRQQSEAREQAEQDVVRLREHADIFMQTAMVAVEQAQLEANTKVPEEEHEQLQAAVTAAKKEAAKAAAQAAEHTEFAEQAETKRSAATLIAAKADATAKLRSRLALQKHEAVEGTLASLQRERDRRAGAEVELLEI
jgi:hypothetical protein